jgi:hypothetical protein
MFIMNHINALILLEFCTRDRITVGGDCGEHVVILVFLQYDTDEPQPPKEVRDFINYCHSSKKQLTLGCSASAHHVLWRSTSTNPTGDGLMEYLTSSKLTILK